MQIGQFPQSRLRRMRYQAGIRDLVRETQLTSSQFIMPLFVRSGIGIKKPILSMPGQFQWSLDRLEEELAQLSALGIKNIILFGIPTEKDAKGTSALQEDGIIQQAIPLIKKLAPHLLIFSDLCFCEYTDHGHCGILNAQHYLDNDATLALLAKQAISHARAGVDVIAPSGMLDGMVHTIRSALDAAGFSHLPILSYAVKYASSFYGPFREAAEGAPHFGDRQSHQMDYRNAREALRECALDIAEGADMLMVKPAHTYLDIISRIKTAYPAYPLGAYHTSGEYAMIKAAAEKGWLNERDAVLEVLTAIHRAGADFILTYFAKDAALWLADDDQQPAANTLSAPQTK
jgi:porphobilinogen synthase